MTPLTQAKILRVLQDQQFERVGGSQSIRTDVRVIAATNRNLEGMVAAGQFRQDLYYRLNVYTIKLPPLRERGEDLPLVAEHFLRRFRPEFGKEVQSISPEALELLRRHSWPGNVRELQSVLKQAVLQATGPVLLPEFLPDPILRREENAPSTVVETAGAPFADWARFVREQLQAGSRNLFAQWEALTERYLLEVVLRHTRGNISRAAGILGIHPMTLRTKLRSLGITVERSATEK